MKTTYTWKRLDHESVRVRFRCDVSEWVMLHNRRFLIL